MSEQLSAQGTAVAVDSKLAEMVQTIYQLQKEKGEEWVAWGEVAKAQEGSAALAIKVSAYAQLLAAKSLLVIRRNHVTLTEAGRTLARECLAQPAQKSQTQEIASAVKRYASGIRDARYKILAVGMVARIDRRYVQSVAVDIGDDMIATNTPVHIYRDDGGAVTHGTVVGQDHDQGVLYLSLEGEVTAYDLPCTLRVDHAFLLHQLALIVPRLSRSGKKCAMYKRALIFVNAQWKPVRSISFKVAKRMSSFLIWLTALAGTSWANYSWETPAFGWSM